MVLVAAGERTERQWKALFASAGLKIRDIYTSPGNPQQVFELDLE